MRRKSKKIAILLFSFLIMTLIILTSSRGHAQVAGAVIRGTVKDASGAVVLSPIIPACLAAISPAILRFGPFENLHQSTPSAVPPSAPDPSKWVDLLPDGSAKSIIVTKCQLCHTVQRIVKSRRGKEDWKDLVDRMVENGAPLTPDEVLVVVDYLAKNFEPAGSNPPSATPAGTSQTVQAPPDNLIVDPDQAQFSPVSDSVGLPKGVQMSIVSGDPSKKGLFSVLLKIPGGQVILPHWLSGEENIVCLRGAFQFGVGDIFDADKLRTLNPGAVVNVPAEMHHFAQAKEPTIILVYGDGPLSITSN